MSWIDKYFVGYLLFQSNGSALPQRSTLNLAAGLTTTDDPTNDRINVAASAGGLSVSGADGIIFRPGGVASGNVYTTWATTMAALALTDGATTVYIDDSISAAKVPPGLWNGQNAKLQAYALGVNQLEIEDGGVLANWSAILGLFVVCDCVTTQALSFATPFAEFSLELGAVLSMNVGATVPAIVITNGNDRPHSLGRGSAGQHQR